MQGQDYGVFIWSSYGVTALVILALVVRAVLQHGAQSRALARLEAEQSHASEERIHG